MKLWIERVYPYGVAAAAAGSAWLMPAPDRQAIKDLMAACISLAGIAFGFLATALSILVSIDDKAIIKGLKAANRYAPLVDFLFESMVCSFVWALASGGVILLGTSYVPPHVRWWVAAYLAISAAALATYVRVSLTLSATLKP